MYISADPVVQQGGAHPEMVRSVVSVVAIRWVAASLSQRSHPEVFLVLGAQVSVPGTVELCACNSGIACQDLSPKCFWCSVHRFLCLQQWNCLPP